MSRTAVNDCASHIPTLGQGQTSINPPINVQHAKVESISISVAFAFTPLILTAALPVAN